MSARMSLPSFMSRWVSTWLRRHGVDFETERFVCDLVERLQIAVGQGHTCIRISPEESERLLGTPVVASLASGASVPLLVDQHHRLYWSRFALLERALAEILAERLTRSIDPTLQEKSRQRLLDLLPDRSLDVGQGRAVWTGLVAPLTVVSGGPGTGKTTLTVKLLEALLMDRPDTRVALAAPTGKAAHRMMQAIESKVDTWPEALRARLPQNAQTLHRLVGISGRSAKPRYHQDRRLPIDYLIIDEASMMDLALSSQVFEALPHSCQVLLLGDKDQLASVESGAVFAELAGVASIPSGTGVKDRVIELTEQFRFSADSGVGRLAGAIREGQFEQAWALLQAPRCAELNIQFQALTENQPDTALIERWAAGYEAYWRQWPSLAEGPIEPLLASFDRFRVLCALYVGPWGAAALNQRLDQVFRLRWGGEGSEWYPGRPVLMTRNDADLGLMNGEVGIAREVGPGDFKIEFMSLSGELRRLSPQRLRHYEVAYAMTIHKSQGSELDDVAVVLPYNDSSLLTRELLYTAVTRARHSVTIWGREPGVESAILCPSHRFSGLRDRIDEVMEKLS